MPQQVHVINAVRADRHARDQARDLQLRVDPARPAGPDVLSDQPGQPGALRQAITGTSPARDTRLGSSKDACVLARLCNNRTYKVSSRTGCWKL